MLPRKSSRRLSRDGVRLPWPRTCRRARAPRWREDSCRRDGKTRVPQLTGLPSRIASPETAARGWGGEHKRNGCAASRRDAPTTCREWDRRDRVRRSGDGLVDVTSRRAPSSRGGDGRNAPHSRGHDGVGIGLEDEGRRGLLGDVVPTRVFWRVRLRRRGRGRGDFLREPAMGHGAVEVITGNRGREKSGRAWPRRSHRSFRRPFPRKSCRRHARRWPPAESSGHHRDAVRIVPWASH